MTHSTLYARLRTIHLVLRATEQFQADQNLQLADQLVRIAQKRIEALLRELDPVDQDLSRSDP